MQMSAANGEKMLARQRKIQNDLENYIEQGYAQSKEEMNHLCNKALYDMAEQRGMSLWDLCFSVVPQWLPAGIACFPPRQDGDKLTVDAEYELKLVPLTIDFEHGPDYWETKYNELKDKVRKLIDEK